MSDKRIAALLYAVGKKQYNHRLYCITRPNTGRLTKLEIMRELHKRFKKVMPDEVEDIWNVSHFNADYG